MRFPNRSIRASILPLLCALLLAACGDGPPEQALEPRPERDPPSPWRGVNENESAAGARIAPPPGEIDEELQRAITEAQATADDARQRWAGTAEFLRTQWAVKWAAVTADERVEYLWVQPVHWSPFRIEGVLASEPVKELAIAPREQQPAQGDYVSFPIEELADWVHFIEGTIDGPREGGFTIDVLEARYGKP